VPPPYVKASNLRAMAHLSEWIVRSPNELRHAERSAQFAFDLATSPQASGLLIRARSKAMKTTQNAALKVRTALKAGIGDPEERR
jgi:hypothetical protein